MLRVVKIKKGTMERQINLLKREPLGPVDNLIGISKTCVEFISIQVFYWRNSYDGPQ